MLGKKMFYKRSVMIAFAVVALMTLTAGVAAAKANSVKFDATGIVLEVGLVTGGTVDSTFEYKKNGSIKSIEIVTSGEGVGGAITDVTECEKPGAACDELTTLLENNGVVSLHDSTATLKVEGGIQLHPTYAFEIVSGTLKGNLASTLVIGQPESTPDLVGSTDLKIKSTANASYGCFDGTWFTAITECEGEGTFGLSNVLIPVELHVKDTGKFAVSNAHLGGGDVVTGKIKVVVDSVLDLMSPTLFDTSGSIEIKKGRATFAAD